MTAPFPILETFAGREGEPFEVTGAAGDTVTMTLTSVAAWGRPVGEGRQPFTVHFHGPAELLLPQSTYRFEHPVVGGLDLFVVPLGPDRLGMRYEAVFA